MRQIALISMMCLPLGAADAHMTMEERTKVMNWLEESRKEFLAAIDGVTEEQWKWKPAPERWSVGETAEHIVLAEALLFGTVQKGRCLAAESGVGREDQGQDGVYRTGDGAAAGEGVGSGAIVPSGKLTQAQVRETFLRQRAEIVKFAAGTEVELKQHTQEHPFPVFGTLNAYQWLIYVPLHTERHDKQIAEVKATAGYPK